jgi:hypothetical protein
VTPDDRRAELDENMLIHVSQAMLARCAYELGVRTGCSSTDAVLYALFWRGGNDSTGVGGDTPAS